MSSSSMRTIVGGPGKWDLMQSLFDGGYQNRREVCFKINDESGKEVFRTVIDRLEREGNDDQIFFFSGPLLPFANTGENQMSIHGTYDVRTRTGVVYPKV